MLESEGTLVIPIKFCSYTLMVKKLPLRKGPIGIPIRILTGFFKGFLIEILKGFLDFSYRISYRMSHGISYRISYRTL